MENMGELDSAKEVKDRLRQFSISTLLEVQAESVVRQNEDTFLLKENGQYILAAVADGGSALSSFTTVSGTEKFSGLFVSGAVTAYLEKEFGKSNSAAELLTNANDYVKDLLLARGVDPEEASAMELPTASGVSIILIDKKSQTAKIAQVGDSAVLVDDGDRIRLAIPFEMPHFDNLAFAVAERLSREKRISYKAALEDEEVGQLFIKSRLFENETDDKGSGAVNGKKGFSKYLRSITIPLSGVRSIAVLSDGMYLPTEDFTLTPDWKRMMQFMESEGLDGLYREVTKLKNEDPEFMKFPRAKKHDDAAGILLKITT